MLTKNERETPAGRIVYNKKDEENQWKNCNLCVKKKPEIMDFKNVNGLISKKNEIILKC